MRHKILSKGPLKGICHCYRFFYFLLLGLCLAGCTKVEYTTIKDPAYLRVFNSMNYTLTLDNKDGVFPYLCMIINPEFDEKGIPVGGEIVGDFLDKRDKYAPPYPSHIGNSNSVHNPEYPGKENVLVGPVLNGFDLSSWAQVPSGQLRVLFMYRPKNTTPFFGLDEKLKKNVLIDTLINLQAKEVYTLHVLQKDFRTRQTGLLLRQENFHKLSLSDSLVYVNFYNYSSEGFWQSERTQKAPTDDMRSLQDGVKDEMNIYLSLYRGYDNLPSSVLLNNYRSKYLTSLTRNLNNTVAPYQSFPLWADTLANGIHTTMWQRFELLAPGLSITDNPYSNNSYSNYASFNCVSDGSYFFGGSSAFSNGTSLPNLLVNIHSGRNNPQSFATVNTIEIINNFVYLTTIQRKYPAPIY